MALSSLINNKNNNNQALKKSREVERRRRRRKQKKNKLVGAESTDDDGGAVTGDDSSKENSDPQKVMEQVEVEYIPEKAELFFDCDLNDEFRKVLEKFSFRETKTTASEENNETAANAASKEKPSLDSLEDEEPEPDTQRKEKDKDGISNKKKKLQRRMNIAELKKISPRPDVVEVWDANAPDPKLLVFLKSYRNTVPVPQHWSQKRKFLQGKRGIQKQPFQLPDYIAATGIEKVRQTYIGMEDKKKLKQKQRGRMRPKLGNMDIDTWVLHDAFFKYQTKSKLTSHGDLYYEGKEFEVKIREMKPGMVLSEELKEALGMQEGAPPPWLINMQRYGPPPSYPRLRIPGVNAPIPPGASFGYHPGGWGKPPVDEFGRPVYGDVFGQQQELPNYEDEPVDTMLWGDIEEEEEEEEVQEQHKEEEVQEQYKEEELEDGVQSVDSLLSTTSGVETPDVIDLRKQHKEEPEKPLYQVLEQKEEKIAPGTLLGTSHTYVIGGASQDKPAAKRVDLLRGQKTDREINVSLLPEELEILDDVLPSRYEEARKEEKLQSLREDFSDMVAENEKKRKRKMKEKEGKSKKKEFKF